MPFQHAIAGGQGNLVATAVQSPNFVHNVSGWQIRKDGSAEFNNVTIRGNLIIDNASGGVFVYSGTPAFGNLVQTLGISAAGIDFFGNAYLQGVTSYSGSGPRTAQRYWDNTITTFQAATAAGPYSTQLNGIIFTNPYLEIADTDTLFLGPDGAVIRVVASNDLTGATDVAKINSYLANGWGVELMTGTYYIDSPIVMNVSGTTLRGMSSATIDVGRATIVNLTSGFTGSAFITVGNGSASMISNSIKGISFNGVAATGSITGLLATGKIADLLLEDLLFANASSAGISAVSGASGTPITWRGYRVFILNSGSAGFDVSQATDSTWVDCETISSGSHGWYFPNEPANCTFIGCRAEYSNGNGWDFEGSWWSGNGSGGGHLIGCSTDRNVFYGISITATGNVPLLISGMRMRRDYSSSTTFGAAIFTSSAGIPVIIDGLTVYPGTNDDGTGNLTPFYGIDATGTNTYISLVNAYIHAASTPLNGSSPFGMTRGRAVSTRAGSTSSPGSITSVTDWG